MATAAGSATVLQILLETSTMRIIPMHLLRLLTACGLAAGITACDTDSITAEEAAGGGTPIVAVSNHPLRFFVERIAGPAVGIEWRVPDGVDPARWNPTADDVAAMQSADLILLNGAGYEAWLPTASLPADRVVDTTATVRDQLIRTGGPVHTHGPGGEHSHAGLASTTWLDPEIIIVQAEAVRDALIELSPADQVTFNSRFGLLRREIGERFASLEQAINTRPTTPVIYSHPVYQYLQRRFGMNGVAVHWDPDTEPDQQQIAELDMALAGQPSTHFIWESEPIAGNVEMLRRKGLISVVFDPSGANTEDGDLLVAFEGGAASLRRVYGATED